MAYASVSELQRVLGKQNLTAAETDAANRVLEAAASEIDWELAYDPVLNPAPDPPHPIVVDVNINRAAELWAFYSTRAGMFPLGPDVPMQVPPRDTWERHRLRLRPLWVQFGVA